MTSYSPKILITGGRSQLGSALMQHADAAAFELLSCARNELDICDEHVIEQVFNQCAPDIVINTAAYTAVDRAEQERDQAERANHLGAKNIASACERRGIPLIHISTDYIFDGKKSIPYTETDSASPVNHYGVTKWQGEQAVRQHCTRHVILRVSGVFGAQGTNFFRTILRLAKEKKSLRIVDDQITCPTYAGDIAGVIYTLAANPGQWGTYHYCSSQPVSWYQFASAIIENARNNDLLMVEEIEAIPSSAYPCAAARPLYSVLDCGKIRRDYGIRQADWKEALLRLTLLKE